ncbi:MAG: ParA family protein, partial [Anaerolineales bacterium]|nr:ParA family protein [Anaerolineales bacterium]
PTGPTSADIIAGLAPAVAAIIEARPNLDIIPGGVKLSAIPVTYGDEWKLAEALDPIAARYDWILIDCPPAWGMITILGLVAAARGILSPITLEPAGVRSFVQFRANLQRLASIRELAVDWILPTAVDRRRSMTTEIREQLAAAGGHLLPGIPQSAAVAASPAWHQTIWEHDPKGSAAAAYQSVIEVLTQ